MPKPSARTKLISPIDPYSLLADELAIQSDDIMWVAKPVDIVEFVESPEYMNQMWHNGRGCRSKIMEILIEISKPNIREAIILLGKGSGKTYLSSLFHIYGIYRLMCMYKPQIALGMSAHSPIYFINIARNERQAIRVFFSEFKGLLMGSPWFAERYIAQTSVCEFPKNISAMSGNSHSRGWLGFHTLQWVGDELAHFLEDDANDSSTSTAEDAWDAAFGSCKTRFEHNYKMVGITTPRYDDDFVMKKSHELAERDDGYTPASLSWECNDHERCRWLKNRCGVCC